MMIYFPFLLQGKQRNLVHKTKCIFVLLFVFCKYYAVVTQQIHASKCHIVCQCMDTSYCILALKHEVKTVVLFLLLFIIQQAVLKKIKWKWNKFYVFSKLFTQA